VDAGASKAAAAEAAGAGGTDAGAWGSDEIEVGTDALMLAASPVTCHPLRWELEVVQSSR